MAASRKITCGAAEPATVQPEVAGHRNSSVDRMSRQEISDHIGQVAAGLAQLADLNKLDALAVACDVVREIAAGNVNSKARQISSPAGTQPRRFS